MDKNAKFLLEQISGLHSVPQAGIFNIRENGKLIARSTDKDGIDIIIKKGTKNKSLHIPVLITMGGINDLVYNDFYIEDDCDVLIVAGCGIHNNSKDDSSHNGIHSFHIGKNSKVKYVEKHFAFGKTQAKKTLNPVTNIVLGQNSYLEMETLQLGGVSYADRKTNAELKADAKLIIRENILTEGKEFAKTDFFVNLNGKKSRVEVISRSVAKDNSYQEFNSNLTGNSECFGHVECDGILSGKAQIASTPKIFAKNPEAMLVHEAAIGKISEEQQNKLMSLGLTKEEAEEVIIKGFLM